MPTLDKEFKKHISSLPDSEKDRIIFRFARKYSDMFKILSYEYLELFTKEDMLEEAKEKIDEILASTTARRNIQRQLAVRIKRSVRVIKEVQTVTKNLVIVIDLHLYLIGKLLKKHQKSLGSRYTTFDSHLAITIRKTIGLIRKLHQDYWLDYKEEMDGYLGIIRARSGHLERVAELPRKFTLDYML